jgi:hypothetical protein
MLELETLLPEILDWLASSSIHEWPALAMAVVTAVASKATGGFYRIHEALRDQPEDARYVRNREIDNLIIVGFITLLTQILAFKPSVAVAKRMWPQLVDQVTQKLDKNIEAIIRMVLFAPGLFISEKLSRICAGQKRHEELEKFNNKITRNWQNLINTTQKQSLLSLAYTNTASQPGAAITLNMESVAPEHYGARPNTALVTQSHVTQSHAQPNTQPIKQAVTAPPQTLQLTPSLAETIAQPASTAPITSTRLKSALGAVPSPVSFQPQSVAMAGVPKTF